jgi:hypothetical protein
MIARFTLVVSLAATFVACSMLGRETEFSPPISTSGVGPFRHLVTQETGLAESRILTATGFDARRGTVAGGVLFVDLESVTERAIYRAEPFGACRSYRNQVLVLEATEVWEGASVREPFALMRADGSVRVYYAGDGGIGLAEAASPTSPLVKSTQNPILAGELSGPTVIDDPDFGVLMYFAEGSRIYAARSDDGVSFTRVDGDASTPAIDPLFDLLPPEPVTEDGGVDESEIGHSLPGAVVGAMPSGRRTVRLYFTSVRADGSSVIAMGASLDGVEFERAESIILADDDASAPVPFLDESGDITHLLFVLTGTSATLREGVSPLETRLPGHPDVDDVPCTEL